MTDNTLYYCSFCDYTLGGDEVYDAAINDPKCVDCESPVDNVVTDELYSFYDTLAEKYL